MIIVGYVMYGYEVNKCIMVLVLLLVLIIWIGLIKCDFFGDFNKKLKF